MGYWKNRQMMIDEQGWDYGPDRFVCAAHFIDPFLQDAVRVSAEEERCDYCDTVAEDGELISCRIDVVVDCIGKALQARYSRVEDELPWDSEDGDYFGAYSDTEDVLCHQMGLYSEAQPHQLADDILGCFVAENQWCERNYFALKPDEALAVGWRQFSSTVKHESRYLFLVEQGPVEPEEVDGVPVSRMLKRLGEVVEQEKLLRATPQGTRWFRARPHGPEEAFTTAADLGTVPVERAWASNRMSPAGIPMFYGAANEGAALKEISWPEAGKAATTVAFETTREMLLLVLTDLPPLPSYFDVGQLARWYNLRFIQRFTQDLSRPVEKDGREHIEYVPTQIVTEYFRRIFKTAGAAVEGIVYPSSVASGAACVVLFVENDQCRDEIADGGVLVIDPTTLIVHPPEAPLKLSP